MSPGLGELLRRWRKERHLSLAALAAQAGVATRTVSGWELGQHQPRLPELEAVLTALAVPPAERPAALALIDAPRAHRSLVSNAAPFTEELEVEYRPVPGHLLRALRQRRGLTLEEVAREIGASHGMVSRWERSENTPAADRMSRLLEFLGASTQERLALTTRRSALLPWTDPERLTVEEMEQQRLAVQAPILQGDRRLMDLEFLAWQAEIWPLAARSSAARELLANGWGCFAEWLKWGGRLKEAGVYARRSIELWQAEGRRGSGFVEGMACAANVAGQVRAHGAGREGKRAVVEWLRGWLPVAAGSRWEATLYREMTEQAWWAGQPDAAAAFAVRACAVAERLEIPELIRTCSMERARLLARLGQTDKAIAIFPPPKAADYPLGRVVDTLYWVAVLQAAGDPAAATHLAEASALIDRYGYVRYRDQADALARLL